MKKVLDYTWPREPETVDALILGCVDRRIKGWRGLFGQLMGFNMSVPIKIPGGVKDLVNPKHPRDTEHLLEKIELFGPSLRNVVVMGHNECLDCGQCADPAFYEAMLKKAGNLLHERFPDKVIHLVFVDFDGIYVVEEELAEVFALP